MQRQDAGGLNLRGRGGGRVRGAKAGGSEARCIPNIHGKPTACTIMGQSVTDGRVEVKFENVGPE